MYYDRLYVWRSLSREHATRKTIFEKFFHTCCGVKQSKKFPNNKNNHKPLSRATRNHRRILFLMWFSCFWLFIPSILLHEIILNVCIQFLWLFFFSNHVYRVSYFNDIPVISSYVLWKLIIFLFLLPIRFPAVFNVSWSHVLTQNEI